MLRRLILFIPLVLVVGCSDSSDSPDTNADCVPVCDGLACGADGCGGTCGDCPSGQACASGVCVAPTCANGVQDPGETGIDCGGVCPTLCPGGCTAQDSAFVPDGYACIWNEEFGGAMGEGQFRQRLNDQVWIFQNLNVNNEQQNYTNRECADPDHGADWNYCVENGLLTIRARDDGMDCRDGPDADNQPDNPDCALDWDESRNVTAYTSGRIITKHTVAHQYGYIEFRARLPQYTRTPESGLWPAIWLLGNNIDEGPPPGATPWPQCGEFDVLEWKSPSNNMGWNALWLGADNSLDACSDFPEGGSAACGPCSGGPCRGVVQAGNRWIWRGWDDFPHTSFHTYGFLWTAEVMEVFIDGEKMSTFRIGPSESAFQQPMFLIVNLALGGSLGGAIQVTDWSTATLEVDYLRWYQANGG